MTTINLSYFTLGIIDSETILKRAKRAKSPITAKEGSFKMLSQNSNKVKIRLSN